MFQNIPLFLPSQSLFLANPMGGKGICAKMSEVITMESGSLPATTAEASLGKLTHHADSMTCNTTEQHRHRDQFHRKACSRQATSFKL